MQSFSSRLSCFAFDPSPEERQQMEALRDKLHMHTLYFTTAPKTPRPIRIHRDYALEDVKVTYKPDTTLHLGHIFLKTLREHGAEALLNVPEQEAVNTLKTTGQAMLDEVLAKHHREDTQPDICR